MNSETLFSMDLSSAFIAGTAGSFPEAEITFDRNHGYSLKSGHSARLNLKLSRLKWVAKNLTS
jgi:hypothetical protein